MVNIPVGPLQAPHLWIGTEVALHVFMNEDLEVNSNLSVCAHNDVRTDAAIVRNITTREDDGEVAWVVDLAKACPCA